MTLLVAVQSCALSPWWAPPLALALACLLVVCLTAYADARMPLPTRTRKEVE